MEVLAVGKGYFVKMVVKQHAAIVREQNPLQAGTVLIALMAVKMRKQEGLKFQRESRKNPPKAKEKPKPRGHVMITQIKSSRNSGVKISFLQQDLARFFSDFS